MEESGSRKDGIVFSRAVRAGQRIYYVDVKNCRSGDMFVSLTESKKIVGGDADAPEVNFEKHKIFIYKEDFEKVLGALRDAVDFVEGSQGKAEPREERGNDEIKIEIDF